MKRWNFSAFAIAATLLFAFSIKGWAYTPPAPREPQRDQEMARGQTSRPPSSYDVQENPLSPSGTDEGIQLEQAPTSTLGVKNPTGKAPSMTVDVSQGMGAVQTALDQLPENGTLEIIGQGVLTSDSLRIPDRATINLGQGVSLVLGDLKAGNLPVEVGAATTSLSEITEDGSLLTVDGLKTDMQKLQKNLKAATTAEAREEIRKSIQKDRKQIREIRQSNLKSIRKKNLPTVHTQAKKK